MDFDDGNEYDDPRDTDPNLICIDCPKCSGTGSYTCHCGGDQCYCGADDTECLYCDQTGKKYITKEQNEIRVKRHKELMAIIWGQPTTTTVNEQREG